MSEEYKVEDGGIINPDAFLPLPPGPVWQPAQYGLINTVKDVEFQLGTVGAYNALVEHANRLYAKIKSGEAKDQSPQSRLWGTKPPKILLDRTA